MELAHRTRLRAGRLSLAVGVVVFAAKVAAWIVTGSVAVFSDAMGREMMPEIYPPADIAARAYAELILRAIGADDTTRSAFADATGAPRG